MMCDVCVCVLLVHDVSCVMWDVGCVMRDTNACDVRGVMCEV